MKHKSGKKGEPYPSVDREIKEMEDVKDKSDEKKTPYKDVKEKMKELRK